MGNGNQFVALEDVVGNSGTGLLEAFAEHRDPVFGVVPSSGDIVWVNAAAIAFYGYSAEQLCERTLHDLGSVSRQEPLPLWQVMNRERSRFKQLHRLASGDLRSVDMYCLPLVQGKDPVMMAIVQDITASEDALRALRNSHQFITSMIENSPSAIFVMDVDGRYLFVNARFLESVGLPVGQVLGHTAGEVFPEALATPFIKGDERVMESGLPIYEELGFDRGAGMEYWTSTKFPLLGEDSSVLGVCGMLHDVTEWRQAQANLRQLARAVEQSPVSVCMTDTSGRITSANPWYCRVSGYGEAEVVGQDFAAFLADNDPDFFVSVLMEIEQAGGWQGEVRTRAKSGEILWEQCSISPIRDDTGQTVNYVVVKDDISERKRLERREKDIERIVRHDLKSPLMSFLWVPKSLRKEPNITDEQGSLLLDMEESAQRMLRMIDLARDIFKMEEGTYEFLPENVNIFRVIDNVLRDLDSVMRTCEVRVVLFLDGRPVKVGDVLIVSGEEVLCHTIMANLFRNAVEGSGHGDVVRVDCALSDVATIAIHNSQPVPEVVRETFFEKYATEGKRFGTGLGTYSAKLMTETQGGTIRMASGPESGTTVTVTLPVP